MCESGKLINYGIILVKCEKITSSIIKEKCDIDYHDDDKSQIKKHDDMFRNIMLPTYVDV